MIRRTLALVLLIPGMSLAPLYGMKGTAPKPVVTRKSCHKLCTRRAFGSHSTCCAACKGHQGPHTKLCELRNVSVKFEGNLRPLSAKLDTTSKLFAIATDLQQRIFQEYKSAQPPHGNELHVQLVDDKANDTDKQANYNAIQKLLLDITDLNQWECAANAFALTIGTYKGHKHAVHLTIAYFPDGCSTKLKRLRELVQETLMKFS